MLSSYQLSQCGPLCARRKRDLKKGRKEKEGRRKERLRGGQGVWKGGLKIGLSYSESEWQTGV